LGGTFARLAGRQEPRPQLPPRMNAASLVESLRGWMPELILSVGGMLVVLLGIGKPRWAAPATWCTLLLAGAALGIAQTLPSHEAFYGLIVLDEFAHAFRWFTLGALALVSLMVASAHDLEERWRGEALGLLLFVGVGLMLMAQAQHLLMAYLAMELVSLSSYVLVGLTRDARSSEAALKYFLFGALSSGIMLFGMSLLFGLTGQVSFAGIAQAVSVMPQGGGAAVLTAICLILVGLAFKMSMVPFHMWTPDVYEGAPVAITAMLSVGPKAAGLALLVRFSHALGPAWEPVLPLLSVLTMVTMTLGNVVAVMQQNVKRLLAYSTIGQVGYLLIGVVTRTVVGLEAMLVYLAAYLVMNLGAFACVAAVCRDTGSETLSAFRGLAKRAPMLALFSTLFFLSLAGLPPLVGFIGKFLLLGSAIEADRLSLAVVAAINSAIALYYYVAIIRQMYLQAPEEASPVRLTPALQVAVGACGAVTVWLGIFPAALLRWLGATATAFLR